MSFQSATRSQHLALLVLICGCLGGCFAANSLGRVMRISTGVARLDAYVTRLTERELLIEEQTDRIVNAIQNDGLALCSPKEILFMRGLVYRTSQVKDIGRTRNGRLLCSSEIGPINKPIPSLPLEGTDQKLFAWIPVMLVDGDAGVTLRSHSLSLAISPDAFANLGEATVLYSVYVYDNRTRRFARGFGDGVAITDAELLRRNVIKRAGRVLIPRCIETTNLCFVAEMSESAMLSDSSHFRTAFTVSGGGIGLALALALLLWKSRYTSMRSRLRRALRHNALSVLYQPIVDLDTAAIVGAEALVRWRGNNGSFVPPDIFIPIAEANGFVQKITQFVINRSLRDLGDVLKRGDFAVSINIASADLRDPCFSSKLQRALYSAQIPSSQIGIELTERSTVNDGDAKRTIRELQALGHRVYIDDFGTGYSSLAYLSELHADSIKIDRAFTTTVRTGAITESLVPLILQIARNLGLSVVVEGIETGEQAESFRSMGSGMTAQGWFFGGPVDSETLLQMIYNMPEPYKNTHELQTSSASLNKSMPGELDGFAYP